MTGRGEMGGNTIIRVVSLFLVLAVSCLREGTPPPATEIPPSLSETAILHAPPLTDPQTAWRRISPPYTNAYWVAIDPSDSRVLYLGNLTGRFSTVYKSQNGGTTWTRILEESTAFAVHPLNPKLLYSAQGVWTGSNFVSISADGGATWQKVGAVRPAAVEFRLFAFHPQNPEVIYAGSITEGVFKSEDGGFAWEFKGPGKSEVFSLAVDPEAPGVVYVSLNAGVYVSRNGGDSWQETVAGVRFSQSLVVGRSGSLYVAGGGYSPDRGCSWVALPMPGERLALDPDSDRVVYAANYGPSSVSGEEPGILVSTDGGMRWKTLGERLAKGYIWGLVVAPTNPRTLYLATSEGLWSYTFPKPMPEGSPMQDMFKGQASLLGFPILKPAYVPTSLSCGLSIGKCNRGFLAHWEAGDKRLTLDLACSNPGLSGQREPYPFRRAPATLIKGGRDNEFLLVWKEPMTEMGYSLAGKGLSWEEFVRVADSLQTVQP